jgi:hypothetical protein
MAVDSTQIQAYANAFVPLFYFDPSETAFPVSVDSWLQQCAASDWNDATDPHAGTTVVMARPPLTNVDQLFTAGGCAGSAGTPLTTTQPLPIPDAYHAGDELFLDFAGWASLSSPSRDLSKGNDNFIKAFYQPWFTNLNPSLSSETGGAPQRPGTTDTLPTKLELYCEAAWAGEFTRLCIQQGCTDFAPAPTSDPTTLQPDTALDPFFVLTYYLFYPCTEPPPANPNLSPGSPNLNTREGQWEAVSLYFNAAPNNGDQITAADLTLPPDPTGVTPAYAVLSQGIVASGDGIDTAGLSADYPAQPNTAAGSNVTTPLAVYVTCGTHKNLFTPTPVVTTSDPNQEGLVGGAAAQGVGAGAAGAGVGALASSSGAAAGTALANFWNPFGWFLLIVGLILLIAGIAISAAAASQTGSTPAPDPQGDIAGGGGPAAGDSFSDPVTIGGIKVIPVGTELTIFSTPALSPAPAPPPWWQFPGRWGVAIGPGATDWDSGGFLTDFLGRTRAYWNTVALQAQVPL